jgi:hypothetical protein
MRIPYILIALLSLTLAVPAVSGAGSQAATFDRIVVVPSSNVQGMGGEVEVSIVAYLYGGCCYSLFANDVRPMLEVPEGLTLLSGPTPERIDSFTAIAGGEPTLARFRYTLRCDSIGSFALNASVDTADCGSESSSVMVHVIKGATISTPTVHPRSPTTDGEAIVSFVSRYPVGETMVVSAAVYVHGSDRELDQGSMKAEIATLTIGDKPISDILRVECEPDPLERDRFSAIIPTDSEHVYYWMVVLDENVEYTTSSIYHLEVEDTGEVRAFNLLSWSLFIIGTIALAASLVVMQNMARKRAKGPSIENMTLRFVLVGGIAFGVLLIGLGILTIGNGSDLFRHLLEGK